MLGEVKLPLQVYKQPVEFFLADVCCFPHSDDGLDNGLQGLVMVVMMPRVKCVPGFSMRRGHSVDLPHVWMFD